MFEKNDLPEIIEDLREEKETHLHTLRNSYIKLFMAEHEKCNHFKDEAELIMTMDIINDISVNKNFGISVLKQSQGNQLYVARGISMMPDIMAGDIIIVIFGLGEYKVGDIIIGYECSKKENISHRIIEIRGRKILAKGNGQYNSTDVFTDDTIFGKVAFIVKRGDELHKKLIGSLGLYQQFVDNLNLTLEQIGSIDYESITDDILKEKENIQKILKDLEEEK